MRPASYIDIDCDIYSGAYQALEWAFTSGIAQAGTVVGYDDWWVMPCSAKDTDVAKFGEAKAHFEIAKKFGVRFACLAGPCHEGIFSLSALAVSPEKMWRPYFIVLEVGAAVSEHGFQLSAASVRRFPAYPF